MGAIGQRHARNLRLMLGEAVDIIAWRTRSGAPVVSDRLTVVTGASIESEYGVREFDRLESALAERPDIALICNPTRLHVPVALQAVEAGCHLFLEKPVSDSLEDVERLEQAVAERGVVAAVGCQLRFHPSLRRVRELLQDGSIGRPVSARVHVGEWLPGWHPYEDYRRSYAARRDLGGGVILTLIHEVDYAIWLFGMPRRLWAVGGQLSDLELDVEDVASVLMDCGSDGRAMPVHVQLDYLQRPRSRGCEIVGERGRLVLDLVEPVLHRHDAGGNVVCESPTHEFERNALFVEELSHFLACTRGEATPEVPLRDGIDALRVALAARSSIETGALMELA
jgi:predicted dehydrogenase